MRKGTCLRMSPQPREWEKGMQSMPQEVLWRCQARFSATFERVCLFSFQQIIGEIWLSCASRRSTCHWAPPSPGEATSIVHRTIFFTIPLSSQETTKTTLAHFSRDVPSWSCSRLRGSTVCPQAGKKSECHAKQKLPVPGKHILSSFT